MVTRAKPGVSVELDRLRGLVADQHRRLGVARGELRSAPEATVIAPPMPPRCPKVLLRPATLLRLIEQAGSRLELMDTTLGTVLWSEWPEPRQVVPVLRPTPGLPAYALRGLPGIPNLVLALFFRGKAEIDAAIARTVVEQRSGEPFLPVFLTRDPDFSSLREQRLAFEYFPLDLDDAAPPPEPRWASYLVHTLELTMRRWGVRQIVAL